jgi:PEP-CTERM motif
MNLISLATFLFLTALPALCDSVSFTVAAFQPSGLITLAQSGNPLLQPSNCQPAGCFLELGTFLATPSTPTVYAFSGSLTLGQQITVLTPFTITCSPQDNPGTCNVGAFFLLVGCCKGAPIVAGTFIDTVNGVSETFHFQLQEISSTPEPATIFLFGTGLAAVGWRRLQRLRHRPA